ncbi:MFS general substrate transporter [Ganoderma sinense ZZ0214-1]|uniref:MFS general substrate transporter n=1 Tax=Ganoderma sinense ZZ0214-1 TaxID=1077348 RepID=A0A2G8SN07_9APHY|nr:MFS general substrate transporter [Ganoderma sinense ZZ0214-1]
MVMESTYEMKPVSKLPETQPTSPTNLSVQSSMAALHVADSTDDEVIVQELPPVDRGVKAWTFCAAGFVLEMMIWGFGFSYGIFQDYYTSHPPFDSASGVAIAAVGTISLAIQYGESCLLLLFMRKYPDFLRTSMWFGLALYFASLFASSFATQVWQLILLQGVGVGIGGGIVYMPVVKLLPEWFSERRGLASGIIFSGTGVGGFVFPLILNALLNKVGLRWTLRIWAISTTLFSAVAMLGMRSRFPVPKFSADQRRPKMIPSRLDFLHTPLFWSFACTTLVQGLAQFPVALYIATFTRGLSDQLTATVVLSLFNSSSVVGQVIIGHLTDRISYPSIMVFSAVGSALAAFFLWGFADAAIYLYFFAVVFGSLVRPLQVSSRDI